MHLLRDSGVPVESDLKILSCPRALQNSSGATQRSWPSQSLSLQGKSAAELPHHNNRPVCTRHMENTCLLSTKFDRLNHARLPQVPPSGNVGTKKRKGTPPSHTRSLPGWKGIPSNSCPPPS